MNIGRNQPVRHWLRQLFAEALERDLKNVIEEPFTNENKKARAQNEYRKFVRNTTNARR